MGFSFKSYAKDWFGKDAPRVSYFPANRSVISTSITPEQALECGTFFSCVMDITKAVGEVPFYAPDNPRVNALLKRPNIYQKQSDLIESIVYTTLVYGECFLEVGHQEIDILNPSNTAFVPYPISIAPYDPDDVIVHTDKNTRMPYYTTLSDSRKLYPNRMIRIRDMATQSNDNIRRCDAYAADIHALIAAEKLINVTFRKGSHIGYTLEVPDNLQDGELEDLQEQIEQYELMLDGDYEEKSRAGGTIVLEGGMKLVKIPGVTPADNELRGTVEQLMHKISAGCFKLAPNAVGSTGDDKYNNVSARNSITYRSAYSPMIRNIARSFEHFFKTEIKTEDQFLELGDFSSLVQSGDTLIDGGQWSQDEVREKLYRMDKVPGGDKCVVHGNRSNTQTDRRGETPTDNGGGSPRFNHTDS